MRDYLPPSLRPIPVNVVNTWTKLKRGHEFCKDWDASCLAPGEKIRRVILVSDEGLNYELMGYPDGNFDHNPNLHGMPNIFWFGEGKIHFWPTADRDYTFFIISEKPVYG